MRAAIPLMGVTEPERINCLMGRVTSPTFTLVLPQGLITTDRVDINKTCTVLVDFVDQTVSITADIHTILDARTFELVARKADSHTQSRNYFRVDTATRVAASSMIPEALALEGESWRFLGETIDISGNGVLCSFPSPIDIGTKARIEIILPAGAMDTITAVGHVVRCSRVDKETYHVGFHFDMIEPESQDKIMACCFEIQRRTLRMKGEIKKE